MISLFLDTSNSNLIIGIYKNNNEIYYLNEKCDNQLSEILLPSIEKAFNDSKLKIQDVDKIFVVNGPGSFTGIRIGLTFAKVLSWSLKKDIIPISELELLSSTETKKKYIVPLIDARREAVYSGMYNNKLDNLSEDQYIKIEELFSKINDKLVDIEFVSYNEFEGINTIKPKINVLNIINKHINGEVVNPHTVNPNYLKKTEAEEKLNQ